MRKKKGSANLVCALLDGEAVSQNYAQLYASAQTFDQHLSDLDRKGSMRDVS